MKSSPGLARAIYLKRPEGDAAFLKRTPAANPDAEDLALQCQAAFLKNEANFVATYYRLCDQVLLAKCVPECRNWWRFNWRKETLDLIGIAKTLAH
jgi:hypothetical protein